MLFDEMVKDGRMPQQYRINSRVLWDRLQLDEAFAALPHDEPEDDEYGLILPSKESVLL